MGCLRLEPVRPERSLRPRVCDGLQQRLSQPGRQRVGIPWRRHGTALAWRWSRALLPRTERQNDGRRGDRRPGVPRRGADAALSGATRCGRRRRDRGRQAISPRDAGRAQRIGAFHGRVELERRAETARADQVDERTGTGLRREVLIQPLSEYHHSGHAVWDIKYHLVWITKYRYKVLRGEVAERARDLLREICAAREVRIVRGAG